MFALNENATRLGATTNRIVLRDDLCSREHAEVYSPTLAGTSRPEELERTRVNNVSLAPNGECP